MYLLTFYDPFKHIYYLPTKKIVIIIQKINDLNININLINQMIHCLQIKMIDQIIFYFVNKKDHPNHNGGLKLQCCFPSSIFY